MKSMLPIAAFGALIVVSGAARATTTIDVTNVGLEGGGTVTLSGPGIDRTVDDTALVFTTRTGAVIPVFCVDIYHDVNLGAVNITYVESPLLTDSSGAASGTGTPLSLTQIGEIEGLADYGATLINQNGADLAVSLSGVQGAIWSIEYPSVTVTGDAQINSLIATDVTYAAANPATNATALYDVTGAAQGQIMGLPGQGLGGGGVSGVPEPDTWSLMTLGVGLLGLGLRARRGQLRRGLARGDAKA
jgi:hypothetical protein